MKTSTVTPSFYYVFNISLYCKDTIPSFIGNLWRVLLPGNHLNTAPLIPRLLTGLNKGFNSDTVLTSSAGPLKKCISSGPLYDGSGNNKNNTEEKETGSNLT